MRVDSLLLCAGAACLCGLALLVACGGVADTDLFSGEPQGTGGGGPVAGTGGTDGGSGGGTTSGGTSTGGTSTGGTSTGGTSTGGSGTGGSGTGGSGTGGSGTGGSGTGGSGTGGSGTGGSGNIPGYCWDWEGNLHTDVATGTSPILMNFEAPFEDLGWLANEVEGWHGGLYTSDDGTCTSGTCTSMSVVTVQSNKLLRATAQPMTGWGWQVGVWMWCFDARRYTGLTFRASGATGLSVRLVVPEATATANGGTCTTTDCRAPRYSMTLTNQLTTYQIPWTSFVSTTTPEWSVQYLGGILFRVQASDTTTQIQLDNIGFY